MHRPNWEDVRRGRPMFRGHTQPLLPHEELGFYDQLDQRVLRHQAQMAKRHGIYGFCFVSALARMVVGQLRLSRVFSTKMTLISASACKQSCPRKMSSSLLSLFLCEPYWMRYIRIEDRPVVLVALPSEGGPADTLLGRLRHRLAEQGVANPFLIGRWTPTDETVQAPSLATCAMPPSIYTMLRCQARQETFCRGTRMGLASCLMFFVASQGVARAQKAQWSAYPLYHAVILGRDNTAQRLERPLVYTRFHVRDYRRWLDAAISSARIVLPKIAASCS